MADLVVDLTKKPEGYMLGGQFRLVKVCPVCGRTGASDGKKRVKKGREHVQFHHLLSFSLNKKNEPVMTASDSCDWEMP
jgi:hypothetical protein